MPKIIKYINFIILWACTFLSSCALLGGKHVTFWNGFEKIKVNCSSRFSQYSEPVNKTFLVEPITPKPIFTLYDSGKNQGLIQSPLDDYHNPFLFEPTNRIKINLKTDSKFKTIIQSPLDSIASPNSVSKKHFPIGKIIIAQFIFQMALLSFDLSPFLGVLLTFLGLFVILSPSRFSKENRKEHNTKLSKQFGIISLFASIVSIILLIILLLYPSELVLFILLFPLGISAFFAILSLIYNKKNPIPKWALFLLILGFVLTFFIP